VLPAAGFLTGRFMSAIRLCGGPRAYECGGAHQVVCDDTEPDPANCAVSAVIATASQPMSSFEHTDPTFRSDAPPRAAAEPPLSFIRTTRRRCPTRMRQDDSPYAAADRGGALTGSASPIS
jgi:hypothetical protein